MSRRPARLGVHLALFLATAVTTTLAGAFLSGIRPVAGAGALAQGMAFSLSLLAILTCHELGHYLVCVRRGVDASLPYFLPAPPPFVVFGTFGAFIRVRSRFPERRALFDMGAAGPFAGFAVAVVVLAIGLRLSPIYTGPSADVAVLGDSLLTRWLARLVLGVDGDAVLVYHPIALAGWFGLLVTALNLLPAGQLDGGHMLYATVGRRARLVSGVVTVALVAFALGVFEGWFVWAAVAAVMTRLGHPPTVDDQRPLGAGRLAAALIGLIILVITFVPEPIRFP